MSLVIADDVVRATGLTEGELRREIAVLLFQQDRLTMGQACRLAGLERLDFQRLLAERDIEVHYDVDEFRKDLQALDELHGK